MSFLVKLALIVGVVVMCIPADPAELARARHTDRSFGVFDAYGLAQAAYNDANGFCGRNPAACETGSAVADLFAAKARTGVKMVASYLETETPAQPAPREATGSIARQDIPLPRPKPAPARQPS